MAEENINGLRNVAAKLHEDDIDLGLKIEEHH